MIAPIASGGMGEVYPARDTKLDRDVALKVWPALFADDPSTKAGARTPSTDLWRVGTYGRRRAPVAVASVG